MKGIDFGSVADWVSGIGSLLAVFAATGVAFIESRRANRADKQLKERDAVQINTMVVQVLRALQPTILASRQLMDAFEAGDSTAAANLRAAWVQEMRLVGNKARRLQQFPSIQLKIYSLLDEVIALTEQPETDPRINIGEVDQAIAHFHIQLQNWSEALKRAADPSAPFNW